MVAVRSTIFAITIGLPLVSWVTFARIGLVAKAG